MGEGREKEGKREGEGKLETGRGRGTEEAETDRCCPLCDSSILADGVLYFSRPRNLLPTSLQSQLLHLSPELSLLQASSHMSFFSPDFLFLLKAPPSHLEHSSDMAGGEYLSILMCSRSLCTPPSALNYTLKL